MPINMLKNDNTIKTSGNQNTINTILSRSRVKAEWKNTS
jgi:hypothetical protein